VRSADVLPNCCLEYCVGSDSVLLFVWLLKRVTLKI